MEFDQKQNRKFYALYVGCLAVCLNTSCCRRLIG